MMPRKKRLTVGMPAKRRSAKVIKIEVIGLEPEEYQNSNDHTYFNESYTVEKYDTDTNEVSDIADSFKNDHTYASLSGYFPPKSWDAMGYSDTAHGQCIFSEEDTHLNEECISFWEKDVLFNHVFCVYENDEVRDNKNVDKKNLDILRDRLSAMFHKRYLFHRSKSVLKLIELYDSENPSIKLSINFFKDLTCEVYVHRQKISNEHEIWHKLPAHLTVLDKAVSLVERISRYNVCVGNPEKEYTDLVPVGEGLSDNKEPGILAVHEGDFKAKTVIGKEYNGTIRTVKCHLLVTGSRCKVCSKYRNALRRRKERLEERQSSNRKYNHTHFKHKDMTHNELLKKLDEQKNEIKSLKEEMIRTKREFDKMKTKVGMKMETNQHNKVKDLKEASKMQNKGSTSGSGTQHSDKQTTSSGQERSLSDEMFAEYKKMMREKQKAAMLKPKVFLTVDELTRDDPVQTDIGEVKVAPPLFMADVQHLLLYALQGKDASIKPRWCRLVRVGKVSKVVAVVLDSLSSEEFKKYPESLPTLVQAFDMRVEMVSPLQYGSSVREDIMNVPISITQLKKKGLLEKKGPSKKNRQAVEKNPNSRVDRQLWATAKTLKSLAENPLKSFDKKKLGQKRKRSDDDGDDNDSKRVKPDDDDDDDNDSKIVKPDDDDDNDSKIVKPDDDDDNDSKRVKPDDNGIYDNVVSTYEMDNYDRRWLMLNTAQMICEGIPTPIRTGNKRYKDYVFSKRKYKEVTDKSPLFAVDCEMVQTRASMMDLARVSFVDENLQVVYDSFVKPWAPVTNYVTQFSGITKEILDPVTTRLQDVQWVIQTYLPPDAILCGQSICGDLASMKIFHPYVIDTSVIYNLTGNRRVKSGLKRLSSIFLRKGIQEGHEGHNSVEDAQATMELVLLKLRNNIEFGDISMLEPDLSDSVNGSIANTPNTSDGVNNPDEDDNKPIEEDTENHSKDTDVTDAVDGNTSPTREITGKGNENTNAKSVMETENEQKGSENVTDVAESGCNQSDNKDATLETDKATSDKLSGQCESSNLTKTLTSHNRENSDIWKRRLFFQNEGSKFIENFLHRIQNQRLQRREGAIIDEPSSVNLYPQSLPIITCKKDKDSERQTLEKIKDVGFCFTHLYGYKNYLKENQLTNQSNDDEETKKCLWKLDRRFWKIMMGLPSNSLFVVILPGREENGNVYSAMTFAKIT